MRRSTNNAKTSFCLMFTVSFLSQLRSLTCRNSRSQFKQSPLIMALITNLLLAGPFEAGLMNNRLSSHKQRSVTPYWHLLFESTSAAFADEYRAQSQLELDLKSIQL